MFPKVTSLGKAPAFFILSSICLALMFYDNGLPVIVSLLVAGGLSFGTILLSSRGTVKGFWKFAFLITLISIAGGYYSIVRVEHDAVVQRSVTMKGQVISERTWGGKRAIILWLDGNRYMAKISPSIGLIEGDLVQVEGYILPLKNSMKKTGGFREDLFWKAKRVKGEFIPESVKRISSSGMNIHTWRSSLRQKLLLSLPGITRGYMLASWLGVKDPDLVRIHSRSGTVHLLAVSGFHVAMLASVLFFIFRHFRGCDVVISLFLWIYVALTGFSPSSFRAAAMLQLVLISRLLGRPVTPINSVSSAGVLMLILNPFCFWDLGWRMSMTASLTISSVVELDFPKRIKALLVSPLVWLSTAFLTISAFGEVPLAGTILNLVAIPLFAILIPCASVVSLWVIGGLPFADLLGRVCDILFLVWEKTADLFCSLFPYSVSSDQVVIMSLGIFVMVVLRGISNTFYRSLSASCIVMIFLAFLYNYIVV